MTTASEVVPAQRAPELAGQTVVDLMANTAVTGATYDIDGEQQLAS
jgi:hypothetical protein